MRALVTGGAGFIGSTLVDRLLAEGHEVDVVDDLSTGSLANLAEARASGGALRFHNLDIRSRRLRRPRAPSSAGGDLPPGRAGRRPRLGRPARLRCRGQRARHDPGPRGRPGGRYARRSSSPPRGGTFTASPTPLDIPVDEHAPHRPLSPYGVSKKAAIDYLVAYRELHGLEFTALALANVYGPRQDPHGEAGVVAIFAGNARRRAASASSSGTASRPATTSTSTTSSTPSPGRRVAAAASCSTSAPARRPR